MTFAEYALIYLSIGVLLLYPAFRMWYTAAYVRQDLYSPRQMIFVGIAIFPFTWPVSFIISYINYLKVTQYMD